MTKHNNSQLFAEVKTEKAAQVNGGFSIASYGLSLLNAQQDSYFRSTNPFYNVWSNSGFESSAQFALYLLSQRP